VRRENEIRLLQPGFILIPKVLPKRGNALGWNLFHFSRAN